MAKKKQIIKSEESSSDEEITIFKKDSSISIYDELEIEEDDYPDSEKTNKRYPMDFKLQLLNQVREANKRKTISAKIALKFLDWNLVKFEDRTIDECKACLDEILKPVSIMRTLDEMLADYEKNYKKFDLKSHPDLPKRPPNACVRFTNDNREKFKKILLKQNPGKTIKMMEIASYSSIQFSLLPKSEQDTYKQQYQKEYNEYKTKKAEILRDCPELASEKKRKKTPSEKIKKKVAKPKKVLSYVTPFILFRDDLSKQGRTMSSHDAHDLYKNLDEETKMKYIQDLVSLETDLEKQFTAQEQKLLRNGLGMPKKPGSVYNKFIGEGMKNGTFDMKSAATIWKSMGKEEKKKYEDEFNEEMTEWQEKMQEWFKTLPAEQRYEAMAKHGFLKSKIEKRRKTIDEASKKKSKIQEDLNSSNGKPVVEENNKHKEKSSPVKNSTVESPTKRKREQETDLSSVDSSPIKKRPKVHEFYESTPKREALADDFDISSISSISAKKKFREKIEELGPYPSLTAAHYFMTKKYSGRPGKVARTYKKLSKNEKNILCAEMKKEKSKFFAKLKNFASENPKYAEKIRKFHENSRSEQAESIDWHESDGTDKSDESSDSDGS